MNGVVQLTMLKAKKTMSKYIICILIVINVTSCKKLATLSPVDEDRVNKEIIDWEQRLYQDSCILVAALRFDAEGGKGEESIKIQHNNYIFALTQTLQYDRFIIRELKKK